MIPSCFNFMAPLVVSQRTPGKEWAVKCKNLAYVIPLKSSKTKLSLYSFVDLTFCIACTPTTTRLNEATSRWSFSRSKEGTNVFIFKLKSRSRAHDWTWQLWYAHVSKNEFSVAHPITLGGTWADACRQRWTFVIPGWTQK